jgi:hypothetical protein
MSAALFRHPNLATPAARGQSQAAAILSVVDRLRQTLDEENQDIGRRGGVDYIGYTLRKSQGLLELKRLSPALAGRPVGSTLRAALEDLRVKLATNRRLLRAQLRAAQAISDLIARAIRDSQSDGTYTERAWLDQDE